MERYLPTIIDAMLVEIPAEGYAGIIAELKSIKDSACYCPPENMRMWWVRSAEALEDGLGDPAGVAWKERVSAIFADKIKVGA